MDGDTLWEEAWRAFDVDLQADHDSQVLTNETVGPQRIFEDIADEFDKSKSLIHYHYDSKDDLLVAFLSYAVDQFQSTVGTDSGDDPRAALDRVVGILRSLPASEDRMVGVITHVEELKRRIPTQLLVVPGESGSRIEMRTNA